MSGVEIYARRKQPDVIDRKSGVISADVAYCDEFAPVAEKVLVVVRIFHSYVIVIDQYLEAAVLHHYGGQVHAFSPYFTGNGVICIACLEIHILDIVLVECDSLRDEFRVEST